LSFHVARNQRKPLLLHVISDFALPMFYSVLFDVQLTKLIVYACVVN